MKFEENWPRGYSEVVQRCGRTDGRTPMDDGRQVITIAHPEPCSGELKSTDNILKKPQSRNIALRKHAYIILTPLNPTFI